MNKDLGYVNYQPTVVGVGMVVLDVILNNGDMKPIFMAGGTCGNVLAGLSFLGWTSSAISRAGSDVARNIMIKDLVNSGVDTTYVTSEVNLETPRIVEKLNSNGVFAKHSFALRCPDCEIYLPRFRSPTIDLSDKVYSQHPKVVVYFFDRVTPSTLKLARLYRESGALVFFEPGNLRNIDKVADGARVSHILKYAGDESLNMGEIDEDRTIDELMRSTGISLVIRTSGRYGLSFKKKDDHGWRKRKSYRPKELHDTCGAGDWTTVGFLYQLEKLARNDDITCLEAAARITFVDKALKFAQALSSLSCMFVGARGLMFAMDRSSVLEEIASSQKKRVPPYFSSRKNKPKLRNKKFVSVPGSARIGVCPICLSNIGK
jgi:fructokinase